jgi:hypothetical protein
MPGSHHPRPLRTRPCRAVGGPPIGARRPFLSCSAGTGSPVFCLLVVCRSNGLGPGEPPRLPFLASRERADRCLIGPTDQGVRRIGGPGLYALPLPELDSCGSLSLPERTSPCRLPRSCGGRLDAGLPGGRPVSADGGVREPYVGTATPAVSGQAPEPTRSAIATLSEPPWRSGQEKDIVTGCGPRVSACSRAQ